MGTDNNIISFEYTLDPDGDKTYTDSKVDKVYENLQNISDFIKDVGYRSEIEFPQIINNVNVEGIKNPTIGMLINLICEGFGFMGGVNFPIIGKLGGSLAGYLIVSLINSYTKVTPKNIQGEINNVWNSIKDIFDTAKIDVDTWSGDLEKYWNVEYNHPITGGILTIEMLSGVNFPNSHMVEYDNGVNIVSKGVICSITRTLLQQKWRIIPDYRIFWGLYYYRPWNIHDVKPFGPITCDEIQCIRFTGICGKGGDYNKILAELVKSKDNSYYIWGEDDSDYHHKWFVRDYDYRGKTIHQWSLHSTSSGNAPDTLTNWLFIDDTFGNIINPDGIALRSDVFKKWGLKLKGDVYFDKLKYNRIKK